MKIGIIGNGFVGSAMVHGFSLTVDDVLIHDVDETKSNSTLKNLVDQTDCIFICLPTPMFENSGIDLSIIDNSLTQIDNLGIDMSEKVIVIKSTVVPGTTRGFSKKFERFNFVFNPEFLTERRARLDFINTARIVLGGDPKDVEKVEKVYKLRFPYTQLIKTDFESAELIKYMANCFFATKIAFMNEMKQICEKSGANWEHAMEGFVSDGRIGNSHLDVPGHDGFLGFGGKCFPKDINAMISRAQALGIDPKVMKAAWEKNLEVREHLDWYDIKGAVTLKDD